MLDVSTTNVFYIHGPALADLSGAPIVVHKEAMESLAPATRTNALVTDLVAPSTTFDSAGPYGPVLEFLV